MKWVCDKQWLSTGLTRAELPDAALGDWVHGTAGGTLVSGGELSRVRQCADHPATSATTQQHLVA